MTEAEFKRDIVRQLTREGGYARRLEDRYAVGTLDLLLLTQRYLIYAEAKLIKGLIALPARVAQREQIKLFNAVGNTNACAIIIGLKDRSVGFGLPGEAYDGALINHPDTDLADPALNTSGVPWHTLYYKGNYPRLQQVKAKWDPRDVFHHALSIRPD